MKVVVWCKQAYLLDKPDVHIKGKCVWKGKLSVVPHKGDYVTIYDGWGSQRVENVYFDLYDQTVVIEIGPDYGNEYPEVKDESEVL